MASSSAAKQTPLYIDPEFRRKFVDEENYIGHWEDGQDDKANNHWKKGEGEGNLIGGEGEGDGIQKKESRIRKISERSEDQDDQPSQIRLAKPNNSDQAAAQPAPTRRVDMSAMRSGREQIKKQIAQTNAIHRQTAKARAVKKPIDWSRLDQVGRPVVSFDPFNKERPRALRILKRDARDRTRQEIVRKYGVEFSRIYVRYRRDAERRKTGLTAPDYMVRHEREQKACEEAAIQCVLRGVTPRQVLEYWDSNIKNYTNNNLTIPPLNFLKSASAIDRVACSALGTVGRIEKTRTAPETVKIKPENRNTFSGVGGLDIRLRPTLEAAGFPTQAYNDRYLLSIQHNALAIAAGKSIFMAEGRVRNMVKHAAKALYSTEG